MTVSRETGGQGGTPLTPDAFARTLAVPRETVERLAIYAGLLRQWQPKINLIGPATLPDLWRRHFLDSAQLAPHLPPGPLLDLGSGAGFPGLVLAILRGRAGAAEPVHLVESDQRKAAFLREVARQTAVPAVIHAQRAEKLAPFAVAAITSRALAPLAKLLELAGPFLVFRPQCLFLKGRGVEDELTQASKDWTMTTDRIPSLTDPRGIILHLKEVHRGRDES